MQDILLKNVNEANESRGNSIECEIKRLEREKGGKEKEKRNSGNRQRMDLHLIWDGLGD